MVTIPSSRSNKNIAAPTDLETLAALLAVIETDDGLPAKRRADICSGVRSLCRAMNLQPESTPVDPRVIGDRLSVMTPVVAGMKKGRFQNCKSFMDAALAYADARFHRRRNKAPLAPEYVSLLEKAPDRWVAARLRRLFHFATERGVKPEEIDDALFEAFLEHLECSTLPNFRSVDRTTRKNWNALAAKVPGWPAGPVGVPSYVDHYVLSPDAFPQTLWDDVDAYLASRLSKGPANLDDLLSEEELFGGAEAVESRSSHVRESTAGLIRYRVRQFASAVVLRNIMHPDQLTGLKVLVAPPTVSAGLKFFIQRAGKQRNSQIRGLASDLFMIAKLWVRSSDEELAKLATICNKVRPHHEGLPESARRSLAPFRDPANVRKFLALPDRIIKDAERQKTIDRATANRVATALWIKIAQRAPLRISNLLETDLSKNILRSHSGKDASVALFYLPDQVKNAKALEVPLPQGTVKLLDLYLQKYRKALVDTPSPWLFPAPDGSPKRPNVMSSDIQRLMRDDLGFAINPHSFRHVAAKLYLSIHPGRYVDVQLLLGHRKLETTVKYYCELEAEEAFKHFDAILLKLEEATEPKRGTYEP